MTEGELIKVQKYGKGDVLLADARQISALPKVLIPVGSKPVKAAQKPATKPVAEADSEEIVVEDDNSGAGEDGNEPPTLTRKEMTTALRAKGQKVPTSLKPEEVTAMFIQHCSA